MTNGTSSPPNTKSTLTRNLLIAIVIIALVGNGVKWIRDWRASRVDATDAERARQVLTSNGIAISDAAKYHVARFAERGIVVSFDQEDAPSQIVHLGPTSADDWVYRIR